jgi:hypothetical protein
MREAVEISQAHDPTEANLAKVLDQKEGKSVRAIGRQPSESG